MPSPLDPDAGRPNRRISLLYGTVVALFVLALFTYWFGIADRYFVFLYYHDMGPLVPDTSPFSRVTSSRYWMAGLVASGFVTLLYILFNFLAGRAWPRYEPPKWREVWFVCVPLLAAGILILTMNVNTPVLPFRLALAAAMVTIAGVAVALAPGSTAARNPWDLVWLGGDGIGLALILIALAQIDDYGRWLDYGATWRIWIGLLIFFQGVMWLLGLSAVRFWRGIRVHGVLPLLLAGASVTYLLLPVIHYLFFSDGYFYITNSDNFLAGTVALQLAVWLITAILAALLVIFRQRLAQKRDSATAAEPTG